MSDSMILTGRAETATAAKMEEHSRNWSVWAWVGFAFLIVGGVDLLLTWLPLRFGNQAWEFGNVTSSLNGMPVPVLGLAAVLWAAVEGRRRWLAGVALAVALIFLLAILVGLVLWATGIPLALQSVPARLAVGMKRALVKTSIQGVVYPVLMIFMIVRSLRVVRHRA